MLRRVPPGDKKYRYSLSKLASHSVLDWNGNSFMHPIPHKHSKPPVTPEEANRHPRTSSESVQQLLKSLIQRTTHIKKNNVDGL